jgi:DnaK suppressor protein
MDRELIARRLHEARRSLLRSQQEVERDELVGDIEAAPPVEPMDSGDLAHLEVEREMDQSLVDLFSEELAELDAAEARLAAGTYGRCTECEALIPDERLAAVPWARLCFEHQRERELARTDFREA